MEKKEEGKKITIRVSNEVFEQIQDFCKKKGMSQTDVVRNGAILYVQDRYDIKSHKKEQTEDFLNIFQIEEEIDKEQKELIEARNLLKALKERNEIKKQKLEVLKEIQAEQTQTFE